MRAIAADEARHAALSWALAAWAEPRLDADARARVEAARTHALADLAREVAAPVSEPLVRIAGFPSAAVQQALVAHLGEAIAAAA
jgi:hypothetical protein